MVGRSGYVSKHCVHRPCTGDGDKTAMATTTYTMAAKNRTLLRGAMREREREGVFR